MKTITKYFKIKSILILTIFLLTSLTTFATHFRYGNVNWTVISTTGSQTIVEFTVTTSYSYGPGVASVFQAWGSLPIGSTINSSDDFYYGIGSLQKPNLQYTITANNSVEKWIVASTKFQYTYNSLTNFHAYLRGCCRVSTLKQNNNDRSYYIRTIVSLTDPTNSPPSASTPPLFYVPVGQSNATIQINAVDPDGDPLTFSWAPSGNSGSGLVTPIPNITSAGGLNTSTGVITLNTTGRPIGEQFAAQVWIADNNGASIAVDFIIQTVGQSTPPQFDYTTGVTPLNGSTIKVQPGSTIAFPVKAIDIDPLSSVTLSAIGLPIGSTFSPSTNTGNPVTSNFNWVTSTSDLGSRTVTFSAVDNQFVQTLTSVTLIVTLSPVFDVPPTPALGVHNIIAPGSNLSFTVQASDPDPNDVCQIVAINGKDVGGNKIPIYSGVTTTPSLPSTAGNTTSLQFSWTPTLSQWGHKHVFFTAEDTYSDQTDHEVSILVNTVPTFTSSPVTTIFSGQLYTYNITANDPDLPYGDALAIIAAGLPSWLTLTDNGNGTATLSGTPSVLDAGLNNIDLSAEDTHHHLSPIPSQNFDINVIPCAFTIGESITDVSCAGSSDGAIDITLTGVFGTPSYAWTGPNSFTASTEDLTGIEDGTYNVTVTSNLGCVETGTYTVGTTPDVTPPTALAQNLSVVLDANGQGSIVVNGVTSVGPIAGTLPSQNTGNTVASLSCDCPSGYVAVGYEGFAGCITDDFRLICKKLNTDGSLGSAVAVTCFSGGQSGTTFSASLAGDKALVGFNITDVDYQFASSRIHIGVEGIGKPISEIANNDPNNLNTTTLPGLNGAGCFSSNPVTTTQYAPDGNVIVGFDANPIGYSSIVKFKYAPINFVKGLDAGSYDNCGIASMTASQTQFSCADLGANTVTLTVTDNSGNSSSATATVDVQDNIVPTISNNGNVAVANEIGQCGSTVDFETLIANYDPTGYQNSSIPVSPNSVAAGFTAGSLSTVGYPNGYYNNNVLPVGPISTSSTMVTTEYVEFNLTAPQGTFFSSVTYQKQSYVNAGPSSASIRSSVDNFAADISNIAVNPIGGQLLKFDVSSLNSVSGSVTFRIYFWGSNGFDWADLVSSYYGGSGLSVYVKDMFMTADNCSLNVTYTGIPANDFYPIGTTTVTGTVTDAAGNTATSSFDVTVNDTEDPVVTCPANISVPNDAGVCGAVVTFAPTVTDNCSGATVVSSPASGSLFPVGVTTVTSTATDAVGNQSQCTFVVTVNDTEDPIITCPAPITVSNDAGVCSAVVNFSVTATDNCSSVTVVSSPESGSVFPLGLTTVTSVATDGFGNTSTCSFDVTVEDNENPVVVTTNYAVTLAGGSASITPGDVDYGSSDNCGIASMSVSPDNFSCSNIGSNTVTLTVTDNSGNTSSATALVDVLGVIPTCSITSIPSSSTFTGGNVNTLYLGYGAQSTTLQVSPSGGNSFSYNWVGNTGLLSSSTSGSPIFTPTSAGTYTYTVTTTNDNGCFTTCSITIDVVDARCGKKNNKVLVCHNGHEICISANAVPAHLSNHSGDNLGPCSSTNKKEVHGVEGFDVIAYPSPYKDFFNIEILSDFESNVDIAVYDMNGKLLELYNTVNPYNTPDLGIGFAKGMYIVVVSQKGYSKTIKVTKMN